MSNYRSELRVPVERIDKLHNSFNKPDQNPTDHNFRIDHRRNPSGDYALNRSQRHFHTSNTSATPFFDDDSIYSDMKRRFDERRQQWDSQFRNFHDNLLSPNSAFGFQRPVDWPGHHSSSFQSSLNQSISSRFERSPDEGVNYVVKFDLLNYDPEQVKVLVRDNQIIVTAKNEQLSTANTATRDYKRSINLPPGVVEEKVTAYLADDGILSVSCPMRPPPFSSINRTAASMSDIHKSSMYHPSYYDNMSSSLSPNNQVFSHRINSNVEASPHPNIHYSTPQMQNTFDGDIKTNDLKRKSKFYLELPIDSEYSPTEIQIKTIDKRIHINARHEEKAPNRTSVREFSKEYDIPDDVDPESLTAKFMNGMLYIEAQDFN